MSPQITWVELKEKCPVDINNLISHVKRFKAFSNIKITQRNIYRSKDSLLRARGELELIFTLFQQILYDRDLLKHKTDEVLLAWLIDNIGRYQKALDEREKELITRYDVVTNDKERVGISRLSSYSKHLKLSYSLIYESLVKSLQEWEQIEDKNMRTKRTFLYIFFQVFNVTMSSIGGLARMSDSKTFGKKGMASSLPTTWQGLIDRKGQQSIANKHESETKEKIDIPDYMIEDNSEDKEVIYEDEEDEEEEDDN